MLKPCLGFYIKTFSENKEKKKLTMINTTHSNKFIFSDQYKIYHLTIKKPVRNKTNPTYSNSKTSQVNLMKIGIIFL